MTTAHIEKDEQGRGLWLIVEHDDENKNCHFYISPDEVIPIASALWDYAFPPPTPLDPNTPEYKKMIKNMKLLLKQGAVNTAVKADGWVLSEKLLDSLLKEDK